MRDGGDILSAIQELLHHQENTITIFFKMAEYLHLLILCVVYKFRARPRAVTFQSELM